MTPRCECHDEPMWWQADPRRKPGGYWRCAVRRVDAWRKYGASSRRRMKQTLWRAKRSRHRRANQLKEELESLRHAS